MNINSNLQNPVQETTFFYHHSHHVMTWSSSETVLFIFAMLWPHWRHSLLDFYRGLAFDNDAFMFSERMALKSLLTYFISYVWCKKHLNKADIYILRFSFRIYWLAKSSFQVKPSCKQLGPSVNYWKSITTIYWTPCGSSTKHIPWHRWRVKPVFHIGTSWINMAHPLRTATIQISSVHRSSTPPSVGRIVWSGPSET